MSEYLVLDTGMLMYAIKESGLVLQFRFAFHFEAVVYAKRN